MKFQSKYNLKLITGLVVVLLVIGYQLLVVSAQQSSTQLVITWQARNFYPADFIGKSPVTPGTPVDISVEAARDSKLLDLSGAAITWFRDGKVISRDVKETTFTATGNAGDAHTLRASVKMGNEIFESSLSIPLAKPRVVIETPAAQKAWRSGSRIELLAVPYFFTAFSLSELNFTWKVDNQTQKAADSNQLTLNIGEAAEPTTVDVGVFVQNAPEPLETAKENIKLLIVR